MIFEIFSFFLFSFTILNCFYQGNQSVSAADAVAAVPTVAAQAQYELQVLFVFISFRFFSSSHLHVCLI